MKQYVYFFTRQDISREQQLVQTAHVALKLGWSLSRAIIMDPNGTYFICIGVRNLEALLATRSIITQFGFDFEEFYEPDIESITSIATYPVNESQVGILKAFNLLRMN